MKSSSGNEDNKNFEHQITSMQNMYLEKMTQLRKEVAKKKKEIKKKKKKVRERKENKECLAVRMEKKKKMEVALAEKMAAQLGKKKKLLITPVSKEVTKVR